MATACSKYKQGVSSFLGRVDRKSRQTGIRIIRSAPTEAPRSRRGVKEDILSCEGSGFLPEIFGVKYCKPIA